jgi:hypothetical protein
VVVWERRPDPNDGGRLDKPLIGDALMVWAQERAGDADQVGKTAHFQDDPPKDRRDGSRLPGGT